NAAALAADADAKGLNLDGNTLQARKMLADLATLRADIARTQAEADKLQAEADAQNQKIGLIKIAVLQKQAEVETAEADAQGAIDSTKTMMRSMRALAGNEIYRAFENGYIGMQQEILRGMRGADK